MRQFAEGEKEAQRLPAALLLPALLLGTGVRLAAVPLTVTMLVAAFVAHGQAFDIQKGGMEYPLTLAVIVLALGLAGPGRFNVMNLIRPEIRTLSSRDAVAKAKG